MLTLTVNIVRCVLLWVLLAGFGHAAEKRVALVIGNNAYQSISGLEKASNDARAMGRALEKAGFRTISVIDGTRNQMNTAINQFVDEVSGGGIGVLFFAGHGVQVSNQNFLVPVDLQGISRESDLVDQGISLQGIQDKLADAKAKFTLLVIDACRDNPLPKKAGRSFGGKRGLIAASSAEGQIVVFSAGAHQQALDSLSSSDTNPNGVFTREFLPWLAKPGVTIRDAVLGVRSAVRAKAKSVDHEQFPAIYDQAEGDFYFMPGVAPAGQSQQLAALVQSLTAARTPQQIEDELWDTIKNSEKAGVFEEYLKQYPKGRYTAQAKVKLTDLKDTAKPAKAPAAVAPATPVKYDDSESALWSAVEKGNTADDYDAYLGQYPKGKYIALAKQRKQKLLDAAANEARQREADSWNAAEAGNSEESFGAYLKAYPSGQYAVLAQNRLKKLQADADARAEQDAWKKADAGSNKVAVNAYLNRYPDGRYAEAARLKLAQIEKEEAEMRPGKVFKDCADCPEMVFIPAGSFEMGGNGLDDKLIHTVSISKPFALAKTEVTQGQWRAVMGNNPSHFSSCGDTCPVEQVSWNDAQEFVRKLSAKTGKSYRLPSEAEWEYACRAGGRQEYCGSDNIDSVAWHVLNSGYTMHSVAGKQANAWGLYDMSGNVWEWLEDCYHTSYAGAPTDGSAWTNGCSGELRRVLRSGSWADIYMGARSAGRNAVVPAHRDSRFGFRPARMLELVRTGTQTGRGRIGIQIQEVTTAIAESLGLKDEKGAYVAGIEKGSPAEKAGIRVRDIILKFDSRKILASSELPLLVRGTAPGTKVTITLLRNGLTLEVPIEIAE